MYDSLIVGGGITGLQLGALLAADGEKVLLLEKSSRLGGRAAVVKKDGYTLDYGIHLVRFGPHSALAETCRRLGREVEFIPLGTSYLQDEDGRTKVFPTGPKDFLTSRLFTFRERLKIISLIMRIRRADMSGLLERSVASWMDENKITGGLRRYFHLVSASMLVCPFLEKASAGELLLNMQKVLRVGVSVMYPRGGWAPLLDLFTGWIKKRGEIRTGAPVEKIAYEKGRVHGVYAQGELIPARKVILSLPAQQLGELLENAVAPDLLAQWSRLRPTAGIVLEYGLSRPVSSITGLAYLYRPISFGLFTSNVEPALAPPGKQLLTWLMPLPVESFADKAALAAAEQELEQALFSFFPGLQEAVEWRRAMHLPLVDGVEVNIQQTASRRPPFKVPGLENLFLVGDSTAAPGAGGDVGHESVLCCYRTIKESARGGVLL
ncbi:MAG: NAD(P)/FAD-dependent oxidoreductase [Dethiobacteria bacterium]